MRLSTLLAMGAVGYATLTLIAAPARRRSLPALALPGGRDDRIGSRFVRPAGPETMRNSPPGWDDVDESSDESFPASDPPAH